jgi:hypothetical protein
MRTTIFPAAFVRSMVPEFTVWNRTPATSTTSISRSRSRIER